MTKDNYKDLHHLIEECVLPTWMENHRYGNLANYLLKIFYVLSEKSLNKNVQISLFELNNLMPNDIELRDTGVFVRALVLDGFLVKVKNGVKNNPSIYKLQNPFKDDQR
jgi:hypothetical protein